MLLLDWNLRHTIDAVEVEEKDEEEKEEDEGDYVEERARGGRRTRFLWNACCDVTYAIFLLALDTPALAVPSVSINVNVCVRLAVAKRLICNP